MNVTPHGDKTLWPMAKLNQYGYPLCLRLKRQILSGKCETYTQYGAVVEPRYEPIPVSGPLRRAFIEARGGHNKISETDRR